MLPYVFLIIFVFLARFITLSFPKLGKSKTDAFYLKAVFIYIYAFCVIRSFDVGVDIPGYVRMYDTTANVSCNNCDYVYFENGYIFLMKICNIIGLSVRGFFYVAYAIILFPIYFFIKRYSKNPLIPVLVFLCFQFFVFDLTGLRQAMAMSICIIALHFAMKSGWKNLLLFVFMVYIASSLHKSSLSFYIAYFIIRLPISKSIIICYIIGAIICTLLNVVGVGAILSYFNSTSYSYSDLDNQQLGLTLVFVTLYVVLGLMLYFDNPQNSSSKCIKASTLLVMTGICTMCLANGSPLLRACMYFYFPIIILPSHISNKFLNGVGLFIKAALVAVLLYNFFTTEVHSFNVLPYEIGLDQSIFK